LRKERGGSLRKEKDEMTTFMKLSLGVVILAATTACEGGPETVGSFGKTDAAAPKDGGAVAADAGDAGDTPEKDGGSKGEAGGGGGSCELKASSGTAACDTCETAHCCEEINACLEDKDCAKIVACSNKCYDDPGKEPDGGVVPDGGADKCSEACVNAGTKAAQDLYNTQDTCVGGSCQAECWN